MQNSKLEIFSKNREAAIKDNRAVATLISTVSGKKLPDPLLVYNAVLQKSALPACLLESAIHDGKKGRYSFLCPYGRPFVTMREKESLSPVKEMLRNNCPLTHEYLPFIGGAIGPINYEVTSFIEDTVKPHSIDPFGLPVVALYFFDCVIVFDHQENQLHYVVNVPTALSAEEGYKKGCCIIKEMKQFVSDSSTIPIPSDTADLDSIKSTLSEDEFKEMVVKAKRHILAGDIFQVVLSRRLSVPFQGNGLSFYRALRRNNPSPYLFHMRLDENCKNAVLIGASPEIMVNIHHRKMTIRPLAGTKKRGATPEEDNQIEKAMLCDEKETAEHRMLVDLARNDMGKFCEANSIEVTKLMQAEYFKYIMHIGSEVQGELRPEVHPLDALFGVSPAGTLSGCPKVRAQQIISEFESSQRGVYGGTFGWLTDQSLYTCIFIRSALLLEDTLHWQVGAGIVYDSDPQSEYRETEIKAMGIEKSLRDMKG